MLFPKSPGVLLKQNRFSLPYGALISLHHSVASNILFGLRNKLFIALEFRHVDSWIT